MRFEKELNFKHPKITLRDFLNSMEKINFAHHQRFSYMAILGKIRERSIFLILVIGMALFAFVISGVIDGNSQNNFHLTRLA